MRTLSALVILAIVTPSYALMSAYDAADLTATKAAENRKTDYLSLLAAVEREIDREVVKGRHSGAVDASKFGQETVDRVGNELIAKGYKNVYYARHGFLCWDW